MTTQVACSAMICQSFFQRQTGSSCVVNFLTQPPTNLPCNPYDPSFNRLRLQCDVAMLHGSSNLRVRWYRLQHRDGQPERVLDRNNPTSVSFRRRFLNDQLLMTSWLHLRNVTEEDIGTYWCQLDDGDELAVVHKPCTVTHLEEAVRYSDLTACTWAFFFSLGPVCVHPYNECSSEPIENQPSPSPVPTSSRHVVRESTNPSTAPGNTASDMFFWFIPVIAVSLIVLIILGAVVLATAVILKKRCTKTSITPGKPTA